MTALSSALIEENSIELELAMQDVGRHILAELNPNIGTVASRALETAAEQGCLALHSRFRILLLVGLLESVVGKRQTCLTVLG